MITTPLIELSTNFIPIEQLFYPKWVPFKYAKLLLAFNDQDHQPFNSTAWDIIKIPFHAFSHPQISYACQSLRTIQQWVNVTCFQR